MMYREKGGAEERRKEIRREFRGEEERRED